MTHTHILGLFAVLFLVPYLIPQILPKKILAVYAVICFLIASYLTYDVYRIPAHERWDGLGGALVQGFTYLIGFGILLGILVRAAGYAFAHKNLHRKYYWCLLIITPLLFCAYNYAPDFYRDWKRRPPSEQCAHSVANLNLGKTLIEIPTLSIISAALDDGNQPINKMDILHFLSNESLRKYCAKTDNGISRLAVNAISINFSRIETEKYHNKNFKAFCANHDYFFCKKERYFGVVPYVEDLALYYEGHYNANKMYGGMGDTLIKELKLGKSDQDYSKFNFIKIDELHDYNGNILNFRCRSAGDNLFCETNFSLSEDVRLIAGYVVSHENTENDIRKLYQDSFEFLNSLKANEVSDGSPH